MKSPSECGFEGSILGMGQMYGMDVPDSKAGLATMLFGLATGPRGKAAEESAKLAANIANKKALQSAIDRLNGELRTLQILRQHDLAVELRKFINGVEGLLYGNLVGWAAKTAAQNLRASEKIDSLTKNKFATLLEEVGKAYDTYVAGRAAK